VPVSLRQTCVAVPVCGATPTATWVDEVKLAPLFISTAPAGPDIAATILVEFDGIIFARADGMM
jgi:hypothetical protein